jgi:hypothetical protein
MTVHRLPGAAPAGSTATTQLVTPMNTPSMTTTLRTALGWASMEPRELNRQPGVIIRDHDGKVVGTMTLDVLDGQIQTIRSVANPDKLRHLGPVADAWAIAREVKQARRPKD